MDLPEARGDRGVHPSDIDPPVIPRRMRPTREMFERFGLTAQCLGCRAIRTGIGTPQTTLSDVAKGLSRSLRKSLKELPRSLATEREFSVPGTRSGPET